MSQSETRERIPLGRFFAQQAEAECSVNVRLALVNREYVTIGCIELITGEQIERTLQAIGELKETIHAACALPRQKMVPYSVSMAHGAYQNVWDETLALVEDAALFLSAYKDALASPELQVVEECLERQLDLRVHHVYLLLAVLTALRNAVKWRQQMREDEDEEVEA